jgi:hypothetical protein
MVLYVGAQVVFGSVDGHLIEENLLQRRPRQGYQQLGLDLVAQFVQAPDPLVQVALCTRWLGVLMPRRP